LNSFFIYYIIKVGDKVKKKHKFLIFAFILIIVKQIFVSNLPIYAIGNSTCDDQLMVNLETSILQFDWLGPFNSLTFVKGMFFPLFLGINAFLGISYINGTTLFYSIACFIFILAIKDLFKKKWSIYVMFTLLLFNPIMYSLEVIGRVYRNSMTPGQVLLIFASIFAIFINRKKHNKKSTWLWSILGGLSLAAFWNTREDAIWILPMILVFTLIMLIEHFIINKKKFQIKKLIVFVLPLIILFTCNFGISTINYMKYGVFTRVDVSNSSFADAMKAIYSVPPKDNIDYVSVPKEKLERLYKISPSLNIISKEINSIAISMDYNGRNSSDGEIEDGWFWWALRFAAEANGYYESATKADIFFKNVTNEIIVAQEKGLIEKQATMPSALMSPWKKGYTSKLFNATLEIIKYTNSYTDVKAQVLESVGSYNSIKLFEIATNDKAIIPNINYNIKGWYKYNIYNYYINLVNIESNEIISNVNCEKEKVCSFQFDLTKYENISNIKLDIYDINNNLIENLNLNDELTTNYNDIREYQIYDYSTTNPNIYQKKVANVYIDRLNIIGELYKKTGPILGILGLISYLIITFVVLFKNHKLMDKWLILSNILASYLVLCIGVAYNEISSCHSISSMYLSGSYSLIIMFTTMSILMLIDYKKTLVK